MAKAKLSDILEGMESQGDETRAFFDRQTGEVILLMDTQLRHAEDEDDGTDLPDWEAEALEQARAVVGDDGTRFLPLPDKFDINEWEMMRDFAEAREDEKLADALLRAIHGPGAFRYFKDRIHEAGIADEWYRFRDSAYGRIASAWCEQHGIDVHAGA